MPHSSLLFVSLALVVEHGTETKMKKNLKKVFPLMLCIVMLVLASCKQSPGEWEREDVVTDYGDYFEHFYRFVPGGFNDPRYEHRILYNGSELLSYTKEHEDSGIECIYDGEMVVYDIHMELFYRNSNENVFQPLPIDSSKKEFYPVYYRLLLKVDVDITDMLLSSGDKYAQDVVLAYAKGDFSEAEKNDIKIEEGEGEALTDYCLFLSDEYHLSD